MNLFKIVTNAPFYIYILIISFLMSTMNNTIFSQKEASEHTKMNDKVKRATPMKIEMVVAPKNLLNYYQLCSLFTVADL